MHFMTFDTLLRFNGVFIFSLLCFLPQSLTADDSPTALKEVGASGVQIVYVNQGQLFHCAQFDIREVASSNESIGKPRVSSGNLRYFSIIGVEEGLVDITVWPKDTAEAPILVSLRVDPNPAKYAALRQSILDELKVDVTITPIPSSKKVRVSGKVQDCWQAQRVMSFIIGASISQSNLINELRWKCLPCCTPDVPRHVFRRHRR